MATETTLTSAKAWSPDVIATIPLDVVADALVLTAATVVGQIEGDEPAIRVPWVDDDGTAGFVPEGEEIPESNGTLTETVITTGKVAQLGKFSREQLAQPGAADMLARAMSRAVVRKADQAFLANATAPTGLLNLPGTLDAGTLGTSLDALTDAFAGIEVDGGLGTHIIAAPDAWAALSKMKTAADANAPLLGAGTEQTERRILGRPVLVTPAMPPGELLVVDRDSILAAAGELQLARDESVYFTSDSVAIRATLRLGWSAMKPGRVVSLSLI